MARSEAAKKKSQQKGIRPKQVMTQIVHGPDYTVYFCDQKGVFQFSAKKADGIQAIFPGTRSFVHQDLLPNRNVVKQGCFPPDPAGSEFNVADAHNVNRGTGWGAEPAPTFVCSS